jgi:phospholipid-binding lipoprotein MlaA
MTTFAPRSIAARLSASLFALALVAGCASAPPAEDKEAREEWEQINDPLEPTNRAIFEFNQAVDKALIKPVAQGYRAVVPQFGRDRVRDFLNNLRSPVIFANDVLQGSPDRAVQTFVRFAFNTGFGIGGLFDIAGQGGIPFHDEDFGQTFAVWGMPDGPYLVLPILGPSGPRDTAGLATEWLTDPVNLWWDNVGADTAIWTRTGTSGVDKREQLIDPLDEIERSSLDYYAAIRSLYRQRRNAEIMNNEAAGKPTPGMSSLASPANPGESN